MEILRTPDERFAGLPGQGLTLVVSPLYHTGPLISVRAIAAGTPLVILGRFDAERTLWAIDTFDVARTLTSPVSCAAPPNRCCWR